MHLSQITLASKGLRQPSTYLLHRLLSKAFANYAPGERIFLFRADRLPDRSIRCLVLSRARPEWARVGDALLYESIKAFAPALRGGMRLRFFLRANPTVKREGKRHALRGDTRLQAWLERKLTSAGLQLIAVRTQNARPYRFVRDGAPGVHEGIDFEGIATVRDPERLTAALAQGIGSAKAFGFGLLSIARGGADL